MFAARTATRSVLPTLRAFQVSNTVQRSNLNELLTTQAARGYAATADVTSAYAGKKDANVSETSS